MQWGESIRRPRCFSYRLNDAFQIRKHIFVGKAEHAKAFCNEKCIAHFVGFYLRGRIVRKSVKLDNQPRREANEIDNVTL